MFDFAHARRLSRGSKKYWVAAVCAASFACGNYLFGDDSDQSESLLSQYQQAMQQLVTEAPPATPRRPAAVTNATANISRLQPAKAQATSTATPGQHDASSVLAPQQSSALAPQQKSSRRVKPSQSQTPETTVAKAESPAQSEPATKTVTVETAVAATNTEPPSTDESSDHERSADNKSDLAQQSPPTKSPPAAAPRENNSLPTVTFMPGPSEVTPNQLAPRMEIITPAIDSTESPRASASATPNAPPVAAKPLPTQAELWLPANPVPSQPIPQIINVSREAVAPPPSAKLANTLAELTGGELPPIVSPDQVPRPGTRKKPTQPAAQSAPVLRIDLSRK